MRERRVGGRGSSDGGGRAPTAREAAPDAGTETVVLGTIEPRLWNSLVAVFVSLTA